MEQLSLDYYQNQEKLANTPSRAAFIDESGTFGFSFEKEGTRRYYVICAVILNTSKLKAVEKSYNEVCCNNGFTDSEMKSSSIGVNDRRRLKILSEILPLDFSIILLIADKQSFVESSPLTDYKEVFVKYLHERLYDSMYAAYPKLSIYEDSFGTSEFQSGYQKYVENNRPPKNLIDQYDFRFVDSKSSRLTQLADFIAGSIAQEQEESSKSNILQILRGKITFCVRFPNYGSPYFANPATEEKEYNKAIFELSSNSAQRFIEKYSKSEDFETRLKVATLRHLLFVVHDIDAKKYVSAKELIRLLSEYKGGKITPNFFYRKVIASLRDDGIIIASCSKGYKIPISHHDIIDYTNSTVGIVGPMLSRLGRCRSLILGCTDGELDILDDLAFLSYKKYFD